MSDQRPSSIDVPAFKRSRDHLRYAFNAALFAFEDVAKATKEYFDTIDPILSQQLSNPDDLPTPLVAASAPPERKRKRTPAPDIDPENPPPKRAMTPFFLFLNQNRPRIRLELQARNENASMTKISEEATRQWRALDADEKAKYLDAYQTNLGLYKEKVKEWKEGSGKTSKVEVVAPSSSSTASASSSVSSDGDKATTATQQHQQQQAPPAAPIEAGQVTPLTDKKQKKHKGDKDKEKDKSYKSRSERRKEKHGQGQGQGQNLEHLATPTPMAKTPLPIPARLFDTPKTDRSEKKKRHGEKEKGKTPRSERKEKKKKHRGSEFWQDAAQVVEE